tara:strand:- start:1017 stop:1235 length:219 start_codon:yes stop_codon:yes gene_type:complete
LTPDLECTLWPDTWFGISITDLCAKHDLGQLTDWGLAMAVADRHPVLAGVGVLMGAGLTVFGPIYKRFRRKQ